MSSDDFVVPRFLRIPAPGEALFDEVLVDEFLVDDVVVDDSATDTSAPTPELPSVLFDRAVSARTDQSAVTDVDSAEPTAVPQPTVTQPAVTQPTVSEHGAVASGAPEAPSDELRHPDTPAGFTFVDLSAPPADALFERFRVISVRDPLDVLVADAVEAKVYATSGLSLTATVTPPVASVREYGLNPTGIDVEWDSVRPLVAQLWNELVIFEYFHGSRFEAWLEVDGHYLLVTLEIDDYTTLWKFTDAFRAVVETASEA